MYLSANSNGENKFQFEVAFERHLALSSTYIIRRAIRRRKFGAISDNPRVSPTNCEHEYVVNVQNAAVLEERLFVPFRFPIRDQEQSNFRLYRGLPNTLYTCICVRTRGQRHIGKQPRSASAVRRICVRRRVYVYRGTRSIMGRPIMPLNWTFVGDR